MNVVDLKTVKKLPEARVAACFFVTEENVFSCGFKLSVNVRMLCSN